MLDLIIIGAGPIGLNCGIEATKNGLSYKIFDKGCLVNSLYNYPSNMTFFSTSDKLEIGGVPFISHGHKPTRSESLEYYRRVAVKWDLDVNLYEGIDKVEQVDGVFEAISKKGVYKAKALVIATGFYDLPYMLNVPGEDLPKVKHYYDEPHPYFGMDVLVVGAANSAIDVALETHRKGANVTLVIREPEISSRVKYWVKPDIDNRIKEGEIKAYFNTHVKHITENEVVLKNDEGEHTIANDFVLAMTGYRPDFTFLESLGIGFVPEDYNKPVYDELTQETNIPNIYLAGVVCGGLKTSRWFIENSRIHAETIIKDLIKKRS